MPTNTVSKSAKKGDIIEYVNLTLQIHCMGVVLGRNKEDNGYEVMRLNDNGQPSIDAIGGVHFESAFDTNIAIVYPKGKTEDGKKIFPTN